MPKYLLIRAGGRSFEWGCGWEISDETTFSPRVAKCHFWRFQDFEIFLLFLLSFYVFYQIFLPGRRKCTSKYDVSGGKGGRTLTLEMLRRLGSWNFFAAPSDTLAHPCYAGPDEILWPNYMGGIPPPHPKFRRKIPFLSFSFFQLLWPGSWNFVAAPSDTLAHPCYAGPATNIYPFASKRKLFYKNLVSLISRVPLKQDIVEIWCHLNKTITPKATPGFPR